MPSTLNQYQQPVGEPMPHWTARVHPPRSPIEGQYCRLEPLELRHAADLFKAYSQAPDGRDWTYMPVGPFDNAASYRDYVERAAVSPDPQHYAVIDLKTGTAIGTLALMRIDRANGVIEVGSVAFSPLLKRTPISTEAQYLLMKHAFDELGYRRYEWKCDALNAPSRQAAARLGFQFEGIFRQAVLYKGRTRDTAWFSIIDKEWPAVCAAFEQWLAPENFDGQGQQRKSLTEIRGPNPTAG
ncbi:acetyltransferase [Caballeronia mineralivorans PML1(12)]|uniref:Acetyltransferase n=1 Tax=Caballeronia mineralivorans PML1(12) TaxID=908627 RepID=A0A0J1CT11_9BURK|nr:acetyltransferase [Caballeronia mineralivorans PML1(12)]